MSFLSRTGKLKYGSKGFARGARLIIVKPDDEMIALFPSLSEQPNGRMLCCSVDGRKACLFLTQEVELDTAF